MPFRLEWVYQQLWIKAPSYVDKGDPKAKDFVRMTVEFRKMESLKNILCSKILYELFLKVEEIWKGLTLDRLEG